MPPISNLQHLASPAAQQHVRVSQGEDVMERCGDMSYLEIAAVPCHGMSAVPGFCQEEHGKVPRAGELGVVQRVSASREVPESLCFSAAPRPSMPDRWEKQPTQPSGHHSTLNFI